MSIEQAMSTLGERHLKMDVGSLLAGARSAALLKYDLPLERVGQPTGLGAEDDHRQGNLRVRVLEGESLPARPDGSACEPVVTVTVGELTRRRVRRTDPGASGPAVVWGEIFDFDGVSASAQVVLDVWDQGSGRGPPDLLGKAVISLTECREGVPHTFFKNLLEGKLAARLLFSFDELPPPEEEQAQYDAALAARQ